MGDNVELPIIQMFFNLIHTVKFFIGALVIVKASELFNSGYVSEGLIQGIDMLISESPEYTTFIVLVLLGLKIMR
jgi:hypothetical protein